MSVSDLIESEYFISAVVGLLFSLALIKLGSGPALLNFKDDEDETPNSINDQSAPSETSGVVPQINKKYAMKKLAPVQNILGLSDDQMGKAIKDTNDEILKSHDSAPLDASDNMNSIVDGFVFLVGICFGCYAINVFTQGDFGRMVAAVFPAEVSALKMKDYIDNFRAFRWKYKKFIVVNT